MRVLAFHPSTLALTLLVLGGVATTVTTTSPGPPVGTDHGVNETVFHTLWSGDADDGDIPENSTAMAELAGYVDIPHDRPPGPVDQWNAGDHGEFPATDRTTSVYPANASLTQGRFVRDAYVETFAVSPSTRAHLGPDETPLYVPPNGSVLATLDYRIDLPPSKQTPESRTSWELGSVEPVETRLLVDGDLESTTTGSKRPTLTYDDLDERAGTDHRFRVVSTVNVTVERTVERKVEICLPPGDENATCSEVWLPETKTFQESVSVTDGLDVVAYEFLSSVRAVEYPDGDHGIAVQTLQPWQGFSVQQASVNGSWEFYSARDPTWDTLSRRDSDGVTPMPSPSQPLQVHAFPTARERAPDATATDDLEILEGAGRERRAPTLPENVDFDVPTGTYTSSDRIVVRTSPLETNATVEIHGLVYGMTTETRLETVDTRTLSRRNLSISVVNETPEEVTLAVRLVDATTGAPIDTRRTTGGVYIDGEYVRTDEYGTGRITLPRRGVYTATYEPGTWWNDDAVDLRVRDDVYVTTSLVDSLDTLLRASGVVGALLFAIFLVDRITGWNVWPPWRGIR